MRALSLLQLWHWPGNLAELQSVVRHAFALTGGKQVGRRHLVGPHGALPVSLQLFAQGLGDDVTSWIAGEETDILPFEVEERRILARALAASGGNVTQAAAALEIGRSYDRPAGVEHNVINANAFDLSFIEIELKEPRKTS